jgi:hypothetical protein
MVSKTEYKESHVTEISQHLIIGNKTRTIRSIITFNNGVLDSLKITKGSEEGIITFNTTDIHSFFELIDRTKKVIEKI